MPCLRQSKGMRKKGNKVWEDTSEYLKRTKSWLK